MSSEFNVILFSGLDYAITVCAPDYFNAYFLIREDNESRNIIYDSLKQEKTNNDKRVKTYKTRKVIIEIVVPEAEANLSKKKDKQYLDPQCVGVLLEYIKIPKTGF